MQQNKAILLIVAIIILGVAGYGAYSYMQGDDNQPTNSNLEASDTDSQHQESSDSLIVTGGLVEGFPSDEIPLYPGGDIVESRRTTNFMDQAEYSVYIQTDDSMQAVGERLETDYMNGSWEIKSYPTDKSFVSHSDEYIVTVSFSEDEDGTTVRYYIGVK